MKSAIRQFYARVRKTGAPRRNAVKTLAMGRERQFRAWDVGDDTFIFEEGVIKRLDERPYWT